jgi:hypothetical protein
MEITTDSRLVWKELRYRGSSKEGRDGKRGGRWKRRVDTDREDDSEAREDRAEQDEDWGRMQISIGRRQEKRMQKKKDNRGKRGESRSVYGHRGEKRTERHTVGEEVGVKRRVQPTGEEKWEKGDDSMRRVNAEKIDHKKERIQRQGES